MGTTRYYTIHFRGDQPPARIRADRMETKDGNHNLYLGDEVVGQYYESDTRGWFLEDVQDHSKGRDTN